MSETFQEKAREMIKQGEGSIAHMYLDVVGKVTIGVGNMLPDAEAAQALPFVISASGEVADDEAIAAEFNRIYEQDCGFTAGHYRQYCQLELVEAAINELLDERLADFEAGLRSDFPGYDSYPEAARLGMLDMAFNLGNAGLVNKFPSFTAAARAEDWVGCARECRRRQIQDSRNEETRRLFLACCASAELPAATDD